MPDFVALYRHSLADKHSARLRAIAARQVQGEKREGVSTLLPPAAFVPFEDQVRRIVLNIGSGGS